MLIHCSSRIVLLKGFDKDGFVWHTNYESQKARQISENPQAAILFYWNALNRQVRIEGPVQKVPAEESEQYFLSSPRGSQIGANCQQTGAALNVHEGPQSISFRFGNMTPLLKGMIVSNEPDYYEDHAFGIRIENLLYVKEAHTPNRFGGLEYLGFEKLTFFPIQTKLVDLSLLSTTEIDWFNDYHKQVWEKVSPLLEGSAYEWLRDNTRPLLKP